MKTQLENLADIIYQLSVNSSQTALRALYSVYFRALVRFVVLYVGSAVVAEEIVSDTFLAIWNNRKSLNEISNFTSYIYKIAKYKSVDYLRGQHMEQINLGDVAVDMFAYTESTPEKELISQEGINLLNEVINRLPANHKLTFKLIREDRLKYKEVAAILDISVKTVEAYMTETIKILRETLKNEIQTK